MTRRFVLPLLDIRSHALDAGTTPEVTDGDAHRRCRDSLVAPVLPHPPACFDFVWGDSLDAIARETQLSGTEEAVVPDVPDCPWAESVLSPLQFSGAGVTQRIVRVPRRSCVVGFVEQGKRRQDQPCRSESHRLLRRVSYRASLHASHLPERSRVIPEHWPRRSLALVSLIQHSLHGADEAHGVENTNERDDKRGRPTNVAAVAKAERDGVDHRDEYESTDRDFDAA